MQPIQAAENQAAVFVDNLPAVVGRPPAQPPAEAFYPQQDHLILHINRPPAEVILPRDEEIPNIQPINDINQNIRLKLAIENSLKYLFDYFFGIFLGMSLYNLNISTNTLDIIRYTIIAIVLIIFILRILNLSRRCL
jgi:hypothetical protein